MKTPSTWFIVAAVTLALGCGATASESAEQSTTPARTRPAKKPTRVTTKKLTDSQPKACKKPKRKKAKEHFVQAENYMKAKVFDEAAAEYERAYQCAPKAHGFLFNIGLAYQQAGNAEKAVESFRTYLERDPKGPKTSEARARILALQREIAARKVADEEEKKRAARLALEKREQQRLAEENRKNKWLWYGIAAGALAAGLVIDLVPNSSKNGTLDALDVLPAGLYAGGAALGIYGTF